jgi:hypothetical protein
VLIPDHALGFTGIGLPLENTLIPSCLHRLTFVVPVPLAGILIALHYYWGSRRPLNPAKRDGATPSTRFARTRACPPAGRVGSSSPPQCAFECNLVSFRTSGSRLMILQSPVESFPTPCLLPSPHTLSYPDTLKGTRGHTKAREGGIYKVSCFKQQGHLCTRVRLRNFCLSAKDQASSPRIP